MKRIIFFCFIGPIVLVAQTTNYRSIGTNSGTLYNTGTASITSGTAVVTFGGGASLPTTVGQGDRFQIDVDGTPEAFYVLSRDNATQITVATNATSTHTNEDYWFRRTFNTLQDWEDTQSGNLVTDTRIEVGVCYDDGDFPGPLAIDGSTTSSTYYMKLTVADVARHDGTEGTGATLEGTTNDLNIGIVIEDDNFILEWLEIKEVDKQNGSSALEIKTEADNVLIQNLLIYDYLSGSAATYGVKVDDAASDVTFRNCIIYNGDSRGISCDNASTCTIQNCTIWNMEGTSGDGIEMEDVGTTVTITNSIIMSGDEDFKDDGNATYTETYNITEDASGTGTGSMNSKTDTDQFADLTGGSEDLHLKAGADAINAGTDLSAQFTTDIDNGDRSGQDYDIGADEAFLNLPIELLYFDAFVYQDYVRLEWVTATEINNDYFTIERSIDGKVFEELFIVNGAGNSSEKLSYSIIDFDPLPQTSYYRLKQTDYDGTFTYSKLIPVHFVWKNASLLVFPNPVQHSEKTYLKFNEELDEEVQFNIFHVNGQLVYSTPLTLEEEKVVELPALPNLSAGIYLLTARSRTSSYHAKMVVK